MSKRRLDINAESIFVDTSNRVANETIEEYNKTSLMNFNTKFKSSNSYKLQEQSYIERNPVNVGKKTGTFASEIEAKIAARKLEDKIRYDANRH